MKKLLLVAFLFTQILMFAQPIDLYRQFNGRLDFTAFGNTLNEFPNFSGYCGQLPSSSATLNLTSGQTFVSAHLYWGSIGTGDFDVDLSGNAITADRIFNYNFNGLPFFAAYKEVTDIIAAGGNGSYTFSGIDVAAELPNYCGVNFAGWGIYVIYSDPSLRLNQISLFDGLEGVSASNNSLAITLTNIDVTSDILSKIGFLAWEGEQEIANNETLLINGILIDNPPLNPANNAFNGTNTYTGSNQMYNMDLDYYDLMGIVQPGDTSVLINLTSSQDFIMVNNVITSVNSELSDATIGIDDVGVLCENDNMTIDYTVYNVNSTAPLALNTPIAVYADAVLIGQTATVADIPIGGSESGSITVNIPVATPNIFNLRLVVDDVGNGTGVVDETDETNNETIEVIDLSMAGILLNPGPACIGSGVVLDSGVTDPPFNIQWYVGAPPVAIPGATNETLTVTTNGFYSVEAIDGICRVSSNLVAITFNPQPVIDSPPIDLFQCDDGTTSGVFDLTINDPIILGPQDPTLFNIKYYETLLDSQNDTNPILGPTVHLIVPPSPQRIYVRIEDLSGSCFALADFDIYFSRAIAGIVPVTLNVCDFDSDGGEFVDLFTEFNSFVLDGEPSSNYNITYHSTQVDADGDLNALPNPYFVTAPNEVVYIRLENRDDASCFDTTRNVDIIIDTLPVINPTPPTLILCDPNNDGFAEFDLSVQTTVITLGDPSLTVTYHGTLLDADSGVLPLPNPYINDDIYLDAPITDITDPLYGTGGVWARVESSVSTCYSVVSFALEVRFAPVATTPAEPLRLCDDAVADGFTFFDLTVVEPEVLGTMDPTEFDIFYYEDQTDAITAGDLALTAPDFSAAIPTPTAFLNSVNPQIIYILVVGNATSTIPPNPNSGEGCYDIVELELIVDPLPADLGPFEIMLCDDDLNGSTLDDEISTFDLTTQDVLVNGGDPTITVLWYETPADEAADNPIVDPTMYQNLATPQTVVGRATSAFGCSSTVTLTLTVLPNPNPKTDPTPLELCDDDDDGLVAGFDLTLRDVEIIDGETDVSVLYYEDLADAQAGIPGTEIAALYTNIVPFSQIVYARVTKDVPPSSLACYTIVELELIVIALPDMPDSTLFDDPFIGCDESGNGQAIFDLTLQDPGVLGSQSAGDFAPITYYELLLDAEMAINAIVPATAFLSGGQPIWVRLESLITGCVRITEFQIEVGIFPTIGMGDDLFSCDDEIGGSTLDDGLSTFDLTVNTPLIDLGDVTLDVFYYASLADQLANIPIATPAAYQNVITPLQQIFVSAFSDQDCAATSFFNITVEPNPVTGDPGVFIACDDNNDGFAEFDLSLVSPAITLGDPALSVTYHGTYIDASNGALPLPNPYTNEDIYNDVPITDPTDPLFGTGGVWARVETTANSCYSVVPFELEVRFSPVATTPEPLRVCDDAVADGFAEFDLTVVEPEVLDTLDPTQFDIYYYEDNADAVAAGDAALTAPDFSLAILNFMSYTNTTNPQDIYVLVVGNSTSSIPPNPNSGEGCYDIVVLQLIVDALPDDLGPFEMVLCDDNLNGSTLDDEISTFDLTTQDALVNGGDPTITVQWFETPADEIADNPIVDPTMYQNLATPQTIIGRPTTAFDCSITVTLTLTVLPNPNPNLDPSALELCDDDEDGIVSGFDLTLRDAEIVGSEPDVSILYYELLSDANAGTLGAEILGLYTNIVPFSQIVYARVTKDVPPSALACYTIVELELVVIALPDMPDATFLDPFLGCDLDGSGTAIFDLTLQDTSVLGVQNAGDFAPITYYTNLLDAEAGINAITPADAFPSTGQTIWVRLESLVTGCVRITQFEIEVTPFPAIEVGNDLSLCDDEINGSTRDDGLSTFDLTLNTPVITLGNGTLTVVYYGSAVDQTNDTAIATPDAYQNIVIPQQEIFVSIFSAESCEATSSFFINVDPNPSPVTPTALIACDDDNNGFAPFTLSDKDAEIIGGEPSVGIFGYFLTEIEAQAGDPSTVLANPYTNIVANMQTVWARAQNTFTGCYSVVPLDLIVNPSPDAPVVPGFGDLISCDSIGGGDAEFNLEDNTAFVYGSQDPLEYTLSYHTDVLEAEAGTNPIVNTTNFVSSGQTIWVRLQNNTTDCYRISSFELIVGEFPLIANPAAMEVCDDPSGGSSSDGIAEFDLTLNDTFITIGDPTLSVFYYETLADQTAGIFIDPATAYQNISNPMTLYVSVFNGTGCFAQTTITISVNPNPEPVTPTPLVVCDSDNDGFAEFMLTDKDAEITGGQPGVIISYHETLVDAENGIFALLSPYVNIMANTQVVYARASFPVVPSGTGCYGVVELELIVSPTPLVPNDLPDLVICDDDGFGVFDLTQQDVLIYGSQNPTDFTLSYHVSLVDAQTGQNAIVNPETYTNVATPEQSIYVRLLDPLSDCYKTGEFLLNVSIGPLVVQPEPLSVCDDLGEANDGITTFDLTIKNDEITGGATGVGVRYYETQADADADTNRIDPETAYVNLSNPQTVYVRVIDGNTECDDTSVSLRLRVIPNPTPVAPDPIALCDDTDSGDEMEIFDLTIREGQILNGQNWDLLYYETQADAIEGDPLLAIPDPMIYTNTENPQIIYIRVGVPVSTSIPYGCFEIVELEILVNPLPEADAVIEDYMVCEVNNDGVGTFDLTTKDIEALNGQDALEFEVLYFEDLLNAQTNTNAIVNPDTFQNMAGVNPQPIYVGIENIETGCYIASMLDPITNEYSLSFNVEVLEGATATEPALPYAICDNTDPNDGFADFDLSASNTDLFTEIMGTQSAPDYGLHFYATLSEAEAGDLTTALPGSYTNIINPQVVYASVSNTVTDCNAVVEVILKVEQLPVATLDEEYRLCVDANGNPIPEEEGAMSPPVLELNLDPSLYDIIWQTPSGTVFGTSVTALEGGTYSATYTEIGSALGCSATVSTTVTVSSPPEIYQAILLNGAFADSHTIEATAEGQGTYIFQLDDGPFIESGIFENVSPGVHIITIKDANGCGSVTLEVGVIDYPRYLTPNQDGYHDTWNIIGIAAFDPSAKIYIFDRFGKLLKQVSPLGTGWDGTYNANPLPSSDYWFVVEYQEQEQQKEFKGHFTLKR